MSDGQIADRIHARYPDIPMAQALGIATAVRAGKPTDWSTAQPEDDIMASSLTDTKDLCPSCTGEMKILGNMGGVTHSQCNACGEVVHSSKEEPKVNAEDKCLKCDHLLNGHSEFGCNVPGCECVAEVKNSRAETSEEYGRKRWDATPVEKRVQLLNSVHRKQPGDVALSFWNRRNWDELSNSIRKDLMRKSA
jgi:hypothetical protein